MNLDTLCLESELKVDPTQTQYFVISHIEGRLDLLKKLIIDIETSGTFAKNDKIVILGNFISSEGSTRDMLYFLREYQKKRLNQVVLLRGVNEQRMVLTRSMFVKQELGIKSINSYRIKEVMPCRMYRNNGIDVSAFVNDRRWLTDLPCVFDTKKFYFVHQGVNPSLSLTNQIPLQCVYMREPFIRSEKKYEKLIVHTQDGAKTSFLQNRIGLGRTTNLSCVVLKDKYALKDGETDKIVEGYFTVKND